MDMTIGKRIGLLRKEKGLTQEELVMTEAASRVPIWTDSPRVLP